jgi:hypothetical protein
LFLHIPKYDGVVVPFVNLLDYFSLNLIIQHILFLKKIEITKITKNGAWTPPSHSSNFCAPIVQNNQNQVHVEKKVKKNEKCKDPYIGKIKGTPKPKGT